MSQHQPNVARSVIADTHRQSDLTIDLMIIEAGLRLKVLPLRDAIIRGHALNYSDAERRISRHALFALSDAARLNIVDVGLFADAVARRPEVAERLRRALQSSARRRV